MNHHPQKPLLPILMLLLSALACTVVGEAPPTLPPLQPQSAFTPQATVQPTYDTTLLPPPGPKFQRQDGGATPDSLVLADYSIDNRNLTTLVTQVSGQQMWQTVETLVGFHNRHALSELASDRGIHAAGDYLLDELYEIQRQNPTTRIDVSQHEFTFAFGDETYPGRNLMLVINGTDLDAGVYLVGAHYDTVSRANAYDASSVQPSADDNGSGVSAVLEMARIMAQQPHRATLVFVFFSAEELDRKGSIALLEDYIEPLRIPLQGMMNLDTIGSPIGPDGTRYDNQMRVFSAAPNDSASRQLARQIEFVARYYVPDMSVNVQTTIDRAGRWGDHMTFSEDDGGGYPAVRLIEQADDPIRGDTPRDTMDRMDATYLTRTTQVALATLTVLVDGPLPPNDLRFDVANARIDWLASRSATRYVVALRHTESLTYDEILIVEDTGFTWSEAWNYEAVAIAAIDDQGQVGRFSEEWSIPQ